MDSSNIYTYQQQRPKEGPNSDNLLSLTGRTSIRPIFISHNGKSLSDSEIAQEKFNSSRVSRGETHRLTGQGNQLARQASAAVLLHAEATEAARRELLKEVDRLRWNRFRNIVWAGFGGPKPFPNLTADEETAVRQLTGRAPSQLAGKLFTKVPRIQQFVTQIRAPGPTEEDLWKNTHADYPF